MTHKDYEVMTGSVPSITLASVAHSCSTKSRMANLAKPSAQQLTRKSVVAGVSGALVHVRFMNRIWHERRMLASLDDNALKDIGLNRADVEREVGRSLFDLPTRRNRWE